MEVDEEEEELPPFALVETQPPLSHPPNPPFDTTIRRKTDGSTKQSSVSWSCNLPTKLSATMSSVIDSNHSTIPGMIESIISDGSSLMQSGSECMGNSFHESAAYSSQHNGSLQSTQHSSPPTNNRMLASSTYLMSSLQTVYSDAGGSMLASSPDFSPQIDSSVSPTNQTFSGPTQASYNDIDHSDMRSASTTSKGFSQLLRSADDTNLQFGSLDKMPVLFKDQDVEEASVASDAESLETGALIVAPVEACTNQNLRENVTTRWIFPLWGGARGAGGGLQTPLIAASDRPVTHLLSNNAIHSEASTTPLSRAKDSVEVVVEDDQCFEVSTVLNNCSTTSVEDVMNILGNPELLRLWCDPIESLVVISTSTEEGSSNRLNRNSSNLDQFVPPTSRDATGSGNAEGGREYAGEWIEATTTALGSPPSSVGLLYSAGQSILETFGFVSYGRITMFVERLRGHVGLIVGPFHGGVSASHSISVSVSADHGGRVSIVDRVRLTRDEQELSSSSFFGCFDSCISRCVLPSVYDYVDQVKTSMARLRLLLEANGLSVGVAMQVSW